MVLEMQWPHSAFRADVRPHQRCASHLHTDGAGRGCTRGMSSSLGQVMDGFGGLDFQWVEKKLKWPRRVQGPAVQGRGGSPHSRRGSEAASGQCFGTRHAARAATTGMGFSVALEGSGLGDSKLRGAGSTGNEKGGSGHEDFFLLPGTEHGTQGLHTELTRPALFILRQGLAEALSPLGWVQFVVLLPQPLSVWGFQACAMMPAEFF